MRLAVVIPAFQHLPEVLTALNSLRAHAVCPDTVYHVQDDESPAVDFRPCIPPEIASVARNERNLGFAGNVNAGAREVIQRYQPDAILFANQDVQAVAGWSQGWDAALLNAFQFEDETQRIGIVAPRLLFSNGAVQSVGGVYDAWAQPVHRCLGWSNPHAEACSTACDVDWTTGAAIAIQTSLFQHIGGFDERFKMYFEDVALCVRAREAGARIRIEPKATLIHNPGSTGGSPHFGASARLFKQEFVDTGRVKPGILTPTMRYWT